MNRVSTQERVLEIIERLKNGESFTSDEIAIQYEISSRTAQRDFSEKISKQFKNDELKRDPSTKKWSLVLEDKNFSKEDELFLNLILEQSKKYDEHLYSNVLKLISKYKKTIHSNTIYTKIYSEDISFIKEDLVNVETAIFNKNIIRCIYQNEKEERILAPLKLTNFDGYWYLLVNDLTPKKSKKIKTFYFKDISNIKITDEIYAQVDENLQSKLDNAINSYFTGNIEPYPVQLYIEKEVSAYFERKEISLSQRLIKKYEDGSIEIELYITNDMEIIPIIQSFLPFIKIISPKSLEIRIKENINKF